MASGNMADKVLQIDGREYRVLFDLQKGRLSVGRHASLLPRISDAALGLIYSGPDGSRIPADFVPGITTASERTLEDIHGNGWQVEFTSRERRDGLALTYTINLYEQRPFILLRLAVSNVSSRSIYLHDMNLLQVETKIGAELAFEDNRKPLDFFKVGWHDWVYSGLRHGDQRDIDSLFILKPFISRMLYNPAVPIGRGRGEFWGEGWGILTDRKSAILAGFVSTADQFGLLHAKCKAGSGQLTLTAQGDGILLEPGEEFKSEWGYLQFIELPCDDPAVDYTAAVARQMRARVPSTPPPAQWTHWYHYFQSITEKLFIDNMNTIDRISSIIPFKIVQLDDGYQSAWGDWTVCNAKFPNGLEHLSKTIRERKYTSGLWLAPFVVDPRSKTAREHPDWLVKDDKGKPIISGYFYDFYGNALDLSQPEVQEHVRNLLDTIAHKWGFGFVKTDFVYAGALPGVRKDPKMTRAQSFRKGMEAVRAGIGDETFLLGCGCPFGPAVGIVDAMRIGPDTAPNWTPYLWSAKFATPLIRNEKSVGSLRNNIRHTLNMSALHQRWWWNDPDCLMVRNYDTTLTDDEVKSNLSLVGLSGGLMISSDDLTRLPDERQKLVGLLTPVLGSGGHPLDLLEREMAEMYLLPVEREWGSWQDLALFNWEDRPRDRVVNLELLGYQRGEKVQIFDFWRQEHRVSEEHEIRLIGIPRHGCRLIRICSYNDQPQLVGDTLHITQGAEIESWRQEGRTLTIQTIDLEREVEGNLWIRLQQTPVSITCNSESVAFVTEDDHVYRMGLKFRGKAQIRMRW